MAYVKWCLGESVMRLLFERGYYPEILRNIFFRLDPLSLWNCSRVCKQWRDFLDQHIWHISPNRGGDRRILYNWVHAEPRTTRIELAEVVNNPSSPSHNGVLIPYGSRMDLPRCIVADQHDIICANLGTIDVYDRPSGKFKRRLYDAEIDFHWKLILSPKFLVGKQLSGHKIHIWARQSGYCNIVMNNLPTDCYQQRDFHFLGNEVILFEVNSHGRHGSKLQAIEINPTTLTYDDHWTHELDYEMLCVNQAQNKIMLCCKDYHDDERNFILKLMNAFSGQVTHQLVFEEPDDHDIVKGLAYTEPLGIVLLSRADEIREQDWITFKIVSSKLLLFDLAHGFKIRELNINLSQHFGDLSQACLSIWCDPPFGHILMAVKGRNTNCSKILIWNLEKLLRSTKNGSDIEPHRVIETGGLANADAIVPSNHKLIFSSVNNQNRGILNDNDFWGDL